METKRSMILTTAFGLLAVLLAETAPAQTINPGVIDPTNSYAGKTYSEWSAAWWQHFVSLPSTNNPFWNLPAYPFVPLSLQQSGPVWFLGGNYPLGGTHLYTNTIPGGVALFLLIAAHEGDNANCPITNNYSEAQLRAAQKSVVDGVTSMTCTIDGVAVTGLTDVLTSPYRVQSTVFDYICPAVHNYLYDHRGLTCYQNSSGTPYAVAGAVEDGVFLMIAPLSIGPHVIHVTCAFPAFGYVGNFTHYLTVNPVILVVDAGAQPGNLTLSWPQTPDDYTVESSPSLSPPDWQPANLIVTTNNGVLQATAPVGTTNQFFRLRVN